jgi:hypothetical protein
MMWLPSLVVVAALLTIAVVMEWRAAARRTVMARRLAQQLEYVLTLIQGVQKHRGLSGQSSRTALLQREQLAQQLDRQWSDWPVVIGSVLPAADAAVSWRGLRAQPTDFNYHCRLIDQLLTALALLERALLAVRKNARRAATSESASLELVMRCREIEDLGRVRGLSVRAAGHAACPIEMAVPLRYLCRRLHGGSLQKADPAVVMALREIQQKLLDGARVSITAERCFELLTPSIDRALDKLRQALPEAGSSTAVTHSEPRAPLPSAANFSAAALCAAAD